MNLSWNIKANLYLQERHTDENHVTVQKSEVICISSNTMEKTFGKQYVYWLVLDCDKSQKCLDCVVWEVM